MATFNSDWVGYVNDADIQSAVVQVDATSADALITAFRFPVAGKIKAAYGITEATLAAGTTNVMYLALKNAGTAGTSTTAISGTAGGTAGWVANTPQTFSLTAGSEDVEAGQWIAVQYDEDGTVAVPFRVQIDYWLDPTS